MRRRRALVPFLILFSLAVAVGVPLFLLLMAISDAIDASPQPLLGMSYVFGGGLVVLLIYMAVRLRRIRRRALRGRAYSDAYLDVAELRSEVTLTFGMALNLLYALFKLGAAAYYRNLLFAAEAFFYLVLSAIRMLLALNAYAGRRGGSGYAAAWRSYRRCGVQLLLLALSMSFVILQSLGQAADSVNLTALVYGSAFWAFYRLTAAIVQLVKFRGADRPFISAAKLLNLSAALMSIFILQNTLLLHFGDDEAFRLLMNRLFGAVISLTVILIALWMILHGTKKLNRYEKGAVK